MSNYGKPIGIWEIRINDCEVDVTPTTDDSRKIRNIMAKGSQDEKFNKVEHFLRSMIKRDNPDDLDEDIERFVVQNFYPLLKELMITFKLTTKEDADQAEVQTKQEIKNLVLNG